MRRFRVVPIAVLCGMVVALMAAVATAPAAGAIGSPAGGLVIPAGATATFSNVEFGACNSLSWGYQLDGGANQVQFTYPGACFQPPESAPDVTIGPFAQATTVRVFLSDNSCHATYYSDGTPVDHVIVSGSNPYSLRFADGGGFCERTQTVTNTFDGFNFETTLTVSPPPAPSASLALTGGPQYASGGATYVTSASMFTISGTPGPSGAAIQSVSYCFAQGSSACGSYTTVAGSSASFPLSGSDGAYTLAGYATDANGVNSATQTLQATLDNTAPQVAFDAPTDGATYQYGQAVTVGYNCDDGDGSGVATCVGSLGNGSSLPTSSLGLHSFGVSTSDNLGNPDTAGVTYGVTCATSGVLQPINADGSSIFKLGRVVPIKQQLQGSCTGLGTAQLTVYVAQVGNAVTGTQVEAISTSAADSGNTMRYDPTSGQYLFNLGTGSLTAGTYQLSIYIGGTNTTGVLLNSVQFSLQ